MTWLVEIAYMNATTGETFFVDAYPEEVPELLLDYGAWTHPRSGVGITIKVLTGEEN